MSYAKEWSREVQMALAAPFPDDEIEFLPRASVNGRALALAHVDARAIMRRLDQVVGSEGWLFDFDVIEGSGGKMVKGRLCVLGVEKCDAGESEKEDELLKAAVSDALKRCGVHFGISRYLYYLPQIWVPYDAAKRRFTETPRLAAGAVERALAVCGYEGAGRSSGSAPRPQAPAPRAPVAPHDQEPPRDASEASGRVQGDRNLTKDLADAYYAAHGSASAEKVTADLAGLLNVSEDEAAQLTNAQMIAAISLLRQQAKQNQRAASPERDEREETPPTPNGNGDDMTCQGAGCGKPLTKGQRDVSQRAFGTSLCPGCQRQQARSA